MRARVITGAVALLVAVTVAIEGQTPQAQADATYGKLMGIVAAGAVVEGHGPPHGAHRIRDERLPAVPRAVVAAQRADRRAARFHRREPRGDFVVADLDNVRRKSSGGWFDPTAYLSGRVPVRVVGTLTTGDGQGRFDLEQATVDGIPVPRVFIQELLAFYTSTPEQPGGVRLDQPFDLPSAIDRIDLQADQATVVQ